MSFILDMSDALDGLTQRVTKKVITVTTVDFVETETVVETTIDAVVQPADMDTLKIDQIDYNKRYLEVHSTTPLAVGEVIVWNGTDHEVIRLGDYQDYNFFDGIAEQVK